MKQVNYMLYQRVWIFFFFSCIPVVHLTSCNRNTTGDVQDFAYCCCRVVNLTTVNLLFLSPNLTLVDTNTTVLTFNVTPTASLYTTTNKSTTVKSFMTSNIYATTSSFSTTTVSTTISPSLTPNFYSTTPDPSASIICFYSHISGNKYRECHCWNYRRPQEVYNRTFGNTTKVYTCFNVTRTLYVGGLFDRLRNQKLLLAAQMAVKDINNRSDILEFYKIQLLNTSTKGLLNIGSKVLLDYLYKKPTKIALIGPSSNEIAKSTAAISGLPRFQILQISYGTDDIDLSEKHSIFPYFFRTNPTPELLYNKARVALVRLFKWNRVGLLYNTDAYYVKLNQYLVQLLKNAGISIIAEASFAVDPTGAIQSLKVQGAHVILGTYSSVYTSDVFCQAYCNDMWGPHYVWLLLGIASLRPTAQCTLKQIRCASRTQFYFYRSIAKSTEENTDIRQTPEEFLKRFRLIAGITTGLETQAKYTYDALWAIADTLNRAKNVLQPGLSLSDFNYGNDTIAKEILKQTLNTDFYGASGRVQFGNDGNRRMIINVYQQSLSGVGWSYKGNYDNSRIVKLSVGGLIWTGGEPFRETVTITTWRYITFGLYVCFCILAGLGILFAIFCLIVILWKRKLKIIRNISVPISCIIIIGCILVYISVFLFGIDGSISPILVVDRICRARLWVFCIGASLIVGGLIAKLHIAYYVLTKRILLTKRRRLMTMLIIIGVIFLISLIILLCWHFINPHARTVKYIKEQVKYYCNLNILPQSPFTIKLTAIDQCTCGNSFLWYPIMIIWALLLIVSGCFYAYQTRAVYIRGLGDTQRCGICMFIVGIGCILGVLFGLTTRIFPDIFFGLVGAIILIVVTAVLIILYLNRVLEVFTCSAACLSRCRNKPSGSNGTSRHNFQCCASCCGSRCPKCFACCLCFCLPFVACFRKLCGCCNKCCCGSGDGGSSSKNNQKFTVNGIGNDREAELARIKRELDMKEKYIRRLTRQTHPETLPVSTQTGSGRKSWKRSTNKIMNQKPDYSHIKSKVDSGMQFDDDDEPELSKLKKVLQEKDDEIEALKSNNRTQDEYELKNVTAGDKSISPSKIKISVSDSELNQDRDIKQLLNEMEYSDLGDSPKSSVASFNKQGYHGARRKSNIQIFQQKTDWSHVQSKLKKTGAIKNAVPKDESNNNSLVIVNAPGDSKFKKISSLSNLPIESNMVPVENSPRSHKKSVDLRRGSAPALSVHGVVTQIKALDPLTEKSEDHSNKDFKTDEHVKKASSGSQGSKLEPGKENNVRIVNGPEKAKETPLKFQEVDQHTTKDSLDGTDTGKHLSLSPNLNVRRGSTVKIFNDPKDYSHVKSKLYT